MLNIICFNYYSKLHLKYCLLSVLKKWFWKWQEKIIDLENTGIQLYTTLNWADSK